RDQAREQERTDRERVSREREAERARVRADRERQRREREAAGQLDTVVAFEARGELSVTCQGGTVIVTGSERNEIRVRARTESGGIRFSSSGARATLEPASGRCGDGRLELTVPVGTRLSASTWSGDLSVRGVHGALEVQAQSGDIHVRDAGERLEVQTLSGDVSIDGVTGEVSVNTVSGDVSLSRAGGEVKVETVSGDIGLRGIESRRVSGHTTSGDISYDGQIADGGRYEFDTHSGEIALVLPANVGAELSISTFSGEIQSDFPITLKAGDHGIGSSQSKRLSFTVGSGTARIVAETFSGEITLSSHARR
ncbi:MAG: DUF4097 family beta strand repeat protein, partial [Gemmatimonadaceae bacterium]|nr:DUF4097 family beta strand repeat protein [Gemmatimonadaceae bacterium]